MSGGLTVKGSTVMEPSLGCLVFLPAFNNLISISGSLSSALLCRRDCGESCRVCARKPISVLKCCPDIDIRGGWELDYEIYSFQQPHIFFLPPPIPPPHCFSCGNSCSRFCQDRPRFRLCCRGEIRP